MADISDSRNSSDICKRASSAHRRHKPKARPRPRPEPRCRSHSDRSAKLAKLPKPAKPAKLESQKSTRATKRRKLNPQARSDTPSDRSERHRTQTRFYSHDIFKQPDVQSFYYRDDPRDLTVDELDDDGDQDSDWVEQLRLDEEEEGSDDSEGSLRDFVVDDNGSDDADWDDSVDK